jgi:septin 7
MHEAKLAKMEAEMKMVFSQKVQEKESKLKQSEEELYARHKDMRDTLEKQRGDLEDKKRRLESGRPLTPEKGSVSFLGKLLMVLAHPLPNRLKGRRASFAARKTSTGKCYFVFLFSALDL